MSFTADLPSHPEPVTDLESLTDLSTIDAAMSDEELAGQLVRRAAALAALMREQGVTRTRKTSVTDIVTAADHAAEEFVTAALLQARSDDGILGEEGARHPSQSGRTWVIDPVDGTYNFASDTLYWCSALSLRAEPADGHALLGAVHHPAADETFIAAKGAGTTRNGVPLPALEDKDLAHSCVAAYLHPARFGTPELLEPYLAMTGAAATTRLFGSGSCELAAVAAGRIDAWLQQSVKEWDWLPGLALVEGVGGVGRVIEHRGHLWSIAGRPTAVAQLEELLLAT